MSVLWLKSCSCPAEKLLQSTSAIGGMNYRRPNSRIAAVTSPQRQTIFANLDGGKSGFSASRRLSMPSCRAALRSTRYR
jgi:hypothetical protein